MAVDVATGQLIAKPAPQSTEDDDISEIETAFQGNMRGYVDTPHGKFSLTTESLTRLTVGAMATNINRTMQLTWRLDDGGTVTLGRNEFSEILVACAAQISVHMATAENAIGALNQS